VLPGAFWGFRKDRRVGTLASTKSHGKDFCATENQVFAVFVKNRPFDTPLKIPFVNDAALTMAMDRIPSDNTDTRDTTGIIGTCVTIGVELELIQPHMAQKPVLRGEVGCACVAREVSVGVFHPAPFGIVGILNAFDIRNRATSAWFSPPRHRSHCSFDTTYLCIGVTAPAPRPTPPQPTPPQPMPPTTPVPSSLLFRNHVTSGGGNPRRSGV